MPLRESPSFFVDKRENIFIPAEVGRRRFGDVASRATPSIGEAAAEERSRGRKKMEEETQNLPHGRNCGMGSAAEWVCSVVEGARLLVCKLFGGDVHLF